MFLAAERSCASLRKHRELPQETNGSYFVRTKRTRSPVALRCLAPANERGCWPLLPVSGGGRLPPPPPPSLKQEQWEQALLAGPSCRGTQPPHARPKDLAGALRARPCHCHGRLPPIALCVPSKNTVSTPSLGTISGDLTWVCVRSVS